MAARTCARKTPCCARASTTLRPKWPASPPRWKDRTRRLLRSSTATSPYGGKRGEWSTPGPDAAGGKIKGHASDRNSHLQGGASRQLASDTNPRSRPQRAPISLRNRYAIARGAMRRRPGKRAFAGRAGARDRSPAVVPVPRARSAANETFHRASLDTARSCLKCSASVRRLAQRRAFPHTEVAGSIPAAPTIDPVNRMSAPPRMETLRDPALARSHAKKNPAVKHDGKRGRYTREPSRCAGGVMRG